MNTTEHAPQNPTRPSPYDVNPYAMRPAKHRVSGRIIGCILTLAAMATLCFGVIYLLWKVAGR